MTSDTGTRQDLQPGKPCEFEDRQNPDIGSTPLHLICAPRRHLKTKVEQTFLRPVKQPPDQRRSIEIADRANAQPGRVG